MSRFPEAPAEMTSAMPSLRAPAVLLMMLVLAGCGVADEIEIGPEVEEPPPPEQLEEGEVPLVVQRGPAGGVLAFVEVRFGDAGPYRFALDTGASRSLVGEDVVEEVGLERTGRSEPVVGVAGIGAAELVEVPAWSIDGVELPPTEIFALELAHHPGEGPDGLLGSDILSRFERIVVDYERGVLTLAEGGEDQTGH